MIAIPNMEKPKGCWDCFNYDCDHWGEYGYDNSTDCPLIEIDETNTELLEFYNEFKKWKASKEVAKYINAVYGERRNDEHTD